MSTPPDSAVAVLGHVRDLDGKWIEVRREYGALQLRDGGNVIARFDRANLASFALFVLSGALGQASP